MQGTQVGSLVWEDPTCQGATKPTHHNCWAGALEPTLCNQRSHCSEKPITKSGPCSQQLEKALKQHWRRSSAAKKKKKKNHLSIIYSHLNKEPSFWCMTNAWSDPTMQWPQVSEDPRTGPGLGATTDSTHFQSSFPTKTLEPETFRKPSPSSCSLYIVQW